MLSGTVTDGAKPVEGAIVMQGGAGAPAMTTGPDGKYTIAMTRAIPGTTTVVASKLGYRTAGVELYTLPDGPVDLPLSFITQPDNEGYHYGDPGNGEHVHDNNTDYCGHCHMTFVKQFVTSAHAEATKDPFVQDLYAGVTEALVDQASCEAAGGAWRDGIAPGSPGVAKKKCYRGGGVLADLNATCAAGAQACDDPALAAATKPTRFGRCADCHAPGIEGHVGGRDLHEATGLAFDRGNHCDVCHHIQDVDLTKPPGVGSALIMGRPRDTVAGPGSKLIQALYGPLLDVPNQFMGGSLQPKFATSELCGGCHEQKQEALIAGQSLNAQRWPDGLPTHSTYSEWKASSFNTPGSQCQFCHMPPDKSGLKNTLDVTTEINASITFGFVRPPEQIRQHVFRDPLDGSPRFIDQSLLLTVGGVKNGASIDVTAKVKNTLAGHAIPTGEPMRSLVLLVRGVACGNVINATSGMTVQDIGGSRARGVVGVDVTANGAALTWASGAATAKAGDVVRVVRATGAYDDYAGIGFFASAALTPAEKGLPIYAPVGEVAVITNASGVLTLASALPLQAGDIVFLGDALPPTLVDGDVTRALAGAAGYTFARTLLDAAGARFVPHYRAVDMVSDNRIAPGATATTTHTFALPNGCASAKITATLLYRQTPSDLSRERGWDAKDYVVGETSTNVF